MIAIRVRTSRDILQFISYTMRKNPVIKISFRITGKTYFFC